MASINSFNRSASSTSVSSTTITFTNNIENFIGRSANEDGRIIETDILSFDSIDNIDNNLIELNNKIVLNTGVTCAVAGKSITNGLINFVTTGLATGAVIGASVTFGLFRAIEKLGDGALWGVAAVGSIFGADTTGIKRRIAEDATANLKEDFYNGIGKNIEEISLVKKDSIIAEGLEMVTEKATELAAATALTVVSGGTATFAVGTIMGLGEAAEKTYNNKSTNTTFVQELGIAGAGILNGLSWVAKGRLGAGAVKIVQDISKHGAKVILKSMTKQIFNVNFINNQLKKSFSLKTITKTGKKIINMHAVMNSTGALMNSGKVFVKYLTGEEDIKDTSVFYIAGELYISIVGYLTLSFIEDTFTDYVSNYERYSDLVSRLNPTTSPAGVSDTTPPALSASERRNAIMSAPYQSEHDGIKFTASTPEGLKNLEDYYQSMKNNPSPEMAGYIKAMQGKGLVITDIKTCDLNTSYQWAETIYFNQKTVSSQNPHTFAHEVGHFFDYKQGYSAGSAAEKVVEQSTGMKESFEAFKSDYKARDIDVDNDVDSYEKTITYLTKDWCERNVEDWKDYSPEEQESLIKTLAKQISNTEKHKELSQGGLAPISDIFDAYFEGELYDNQGMCGHGQKYYTRPGSKGAELIANFVTILKNEGEQRLREIFPQEVVDKMLEIINRML